LFALSFTFRVAVRVPVAVGVNVTLIVQADLAAKSTCTIGVTFTPSAKGTRTATLNVNDSANNSPQTASLTGTGK